jgi:post-segregation antitoxin (ccd killing protein)
MKSKVTLLVDKDTVEKAKEIGINLSQFLEHNLKKAIRAMEYHASDSLSTMVDNIEHSSGVKRQG